MTQTIQRALAAMIFSHYIVIWDFINNKGVNLLLFIIFYRKNEEVSKNYYLTDKLKMFFSSMGSQSKMAIWK